MHSVLRLSAVRLNVAGIVVVGAVLLAAPATAAFADAHCGNGVIEADEECDDGGGCIGGATAGASCTQEADCPGGHCKPFGGDGCAANCTVESEPSTYLTPRLASETLWAISFRIGSSVPLLVGKERNGQIPVVIKAAALQFPRVHAANLFCSCLRGVAAKTCGGTFLEPDGVTRSPDCTLDDTVCAATSPCTFVHGRGNAAAGVIGCDGLDGVDVTVTPTCVDSDAGQPYRTSVRLGGTGGPGSAALLITTAVGTVVGPCEGSGAEYGPDGQFCTADDLVAARGTLSTQPFVTGTATAVACDADTQNCSPWSICGLLPSPFLTLGCACCPPGRPCYSGSEPCFSPCSVAGAPFECSELAQGNAVGACLATAYAAPPSLGGRATMRLCITSPPAVMPTPPVPTVTPTLTPQPCVGDCNGDGLVTVDEIIRGINIALESAVIESCPNFNLGCCPHTSDACVLTIVCMFQPINNALNGCPP